MSFKTLDIEKDPMAQGFQESSYDLVVCSLVLHATESLEKTLCNVRRLLKPGGYLVMLEITNTNAVRMGLLMGGLPGWWLGHADNRALTPCVSASRWDVELRNSGFAGIDTITPEVDTHAWIFSVILAQATNQRVEFLKNPLLSSLSLPELLSKRLIIIGGAKPETSELVGSLQVLLEFRYGDVIHIDSVEAFNPSAETGTTTILSLVDLDQPVFKHLTTPQLDSLRQIFESSRNVLWITKGARSSNPYAAMVIGFSRTLSIEMPHLRLQLLHHEGSQKVSAEKIVESLLRLDVMDAWETKADGTEILWTTEPELTLEGDRLTVPRLYPSTDLNGRYNSIRRKIIKPVELSRTVVRLAHTEAGYTSCVTLCKVTAPDAQSHDLLSIRIAYSSGLAVRISDHACLFLAKGTVTISGEWVLAVVLELASEVLVPRAWTIPCNPPSVNGGEELAVLGMHLIAQYILERTSAHGTLLIHDPSPTLAKIVVALAAAQQISCVVTTTDSQSRIPEAVYIHPRSTLQAIKSVVPARVDSYANLARQSTEIGRFIADLYPQSTLKWDVEDVSSNLTFHNNKRHSDSIIGLHLWKAASFCQHTAFTSLAGSINATPLSIKDMISRPGPGADDLSTVVDWTTITVPVRVGSVDALILFKPNKTYLLFGLSGQLGRSLTLYMIRHGAKHIVLTSRTPSVDDAWIAKTRDLGIEVQVLAK
jgi:hybrid polyketide synthase/nonribosomal peptide synthetase ACE1